MASIALCYEVVRCDVPTSDAFVADKDIALSLFLSLSPGFTRFSMHRTMDSYRALQWHLQMSWTDRFYSDVVDAPPLA